VRHQPSDTDRDTAILARPRRRDPHQGRTRQSDLRNDRRRATHSGNREQNPATPLDAH
jgi:hypothetical protein